MPPTAAANPVFRGLGPDHAAPVSLDTRALGARKKYSGGLGRGVVRDEKNPMGRWVTTALLLLLAATLVVLLVGYAYAECTQVLRAR